MSSSSPPDPQLLAYEQMPYESNPFAESHPDRIAAVATLHGLDPAPPQRCRVLELGCAAGGNLLAAAEALPDSTFVGIDLAPGQIADGQAMVRAVGLKNVRLEAMSLTDIPADYGPFDYIIAHGLYSWVPPDVQRRFMEVCKAHLASPHGVLYVSYNANPWWRVRGIVRDILQYAPAAATDPRQRLADARALATTILESLGPDEEGLYARVLRRELQTALRMADSFLFHEYLEPCHAPLYSHEFAGHAAAHRLVYLADARPEIAVARVEQRLRPHERELTGGDPVRYQQCLDFAFGREFRRSLLCHAGALPSPAAIDASRITRCHVGARLLPASAIDPRPGAEVFFQSSDGDAYSTADVAQKAALLALSAAAPRWIPFDEIWEYVRGALGLPAGSPQRPRVAQLVAAWFASGIVDLHLLPPAFVTTVSRRPLASALARYQAAAGGPIHTRRHETLRTLDDADRRLLQRLDGTRDLRALQDSADAGAPADESELQESLQRLAARAVLIA